MLFSHQSDRLKISNESRVLNMAKINGIQLPTDLSGSLGGTPEEAAKVFLSAASKGLAKVIADALVDAVGETIGDGAAPDWTKLITGAAIHLDWETPPKTLPQRIVAFAQTGEDALGRVSVGISISAEF
ncbi:MAG: hypothetical protein ACK552_21975 [Microcystis sp.]|jgi:hypothetical protein|nr:hypothetical protein [Microcystis aeruginosa LG13-12]